MADIEKRYERIGNQPTAIVEASKGKTFGKYHYMRSEFADFTQQKKRDREASLFLFRAVKRLFYPRYFIKILA